MTWTCDMRLPPVNECSLSHQTQRRGQPVRRTKTVGNPERVASPCKEKKISLILSETGLLLLTLLLFQALLGCCRCGAVRILAGDAFVGRACAFGVTQFLLARRDVDQRVGRLRVLRPFAGDELVRFDRLLAVT